jgi:putative ABC transport system permease protein
MATLVLAQSFWVGIVGVALAVPAVYALAFLADHYAQLNVDTHLWIVGSAAAITLVMAMLSGLAALRSLRLVEPATLLR